jgi:hypothetical protein
VPEVVLGVVLAAAGAGDEVEDTALSAPLDFDSVLDSFPVVTLDPFVPSEADAAALSPDFAPPFPA